MSDGPRVPRWVVRLGRTWRGAVAVAWLLLAIGVLAGIVAWALAVGTGR